MAAKSRKTVLSLGAHPDDAEFLCAGTLALLHQKGWEIHIATMAPGDCGTVQYSREEISRIRKAEAAKSASLLDGAYHCCECGDIFILYDRPSLLKAIELVRKVKPAIVFTTSPSDYMVDHEMNIQSALEAPRFTKLTFGGCDVNIEARVPEKVREVLKMRGHDLKLLGDFSNVVGGGQAVLHDSKSKVNYGASDPRKDGAAMPEPAPYFKKTPATPAATPSPARPKPPAAPAKGK